MKLKDYTLEELQIILNSSKNIREFINNVNQSSSGNAYKRIEKYLNDNNLDYTHFNNDRWSSKEKSIEEVFVKGKYFSQKSLKSKVIKYNLLDYKCTCGNEGIWESSKLVLQLDHINGVSNDNRIENLRFLCPNCHSQTNTFSGKNNNK